ncbi:MAG TPA: PaaI family thioesterase [Usitatibacter sp.]|jgi:uncharacterized protein (TIGR00369 family)|nr:PaaI family thioesterase [Usitatibacter sp.]
MTTDLDKELGRAIPFANHLGVKLLERGGGVARFELELRPELMNSFHAAHGGVVMTLLDIAMAIAARTMDEHAVGAITVEMKTSFIAIGKGTLIAEGRCVHHGGTVSFCESDAKDSSGRTIARASGTFMLRKERGAR